MAKYLDQTGLQTLWNKIKSITPVIYICEDGEYDSSTLKPTLIGVENCMYLVPKNVQSNNIPIVGTAIVGDAVLGSGNSGPQVGSAIVGSATLGVGEEPDSDIDLDNYYIEWVFKNSAYERVGESEATDDDIINMLQQIGFIEVEVEAIVDEAIVDEAIVG